MSEGAHTVVIADGQEFMRAGVRVVLEREGFEICGEAKDAEEALALVAQERPKLCLIDVELEGGGIEATRKITRLVPETTVVMLTSSASDEHMVAAFRAGANGYLLKDAPIESLPRALEAALRGEAPVARALVGVLIDHVARNGSRHVVLEKGEVLSLTYREWDVARLLREGRSTQEIANALAISPVTVRRHISEILSKLGASSRSSAMELLAGVRA